MLTAIGAVLGDKALFVKDIDTVNTRPVLDGDHFLDTGRSACRLSFFRPSLPGLAGRETFQIERLLWSAPFFNSA